MPSPVPLEGFVTVPADPWSIYALEHRQTPMRFIRVDFRGRESGPAVNLRSYDKPRGDPALANLCNKFIFMIGGGLGEKSDFGRYAESTKSCQMYSIGTNTWHRAPHLNGPTFGTPVCTMENRWIYSIGHGPEGIERLDALAFAQTRSKSVTWEKMKLSEDLFKFAMDYRSWQSHTIETRSNEVVIFPAGEQIPGTNYEKMSGQGKGISNHCFLILSTDPKAVNMKKRCSKLRKERGRAQDQQLLMTTMTGPQETQKMAKRTPWNVALPSYVVFEYKATENPGDGSSRLPRILDNITEYATYQ